MTKKRFLAKLTGDLRARAEKILASGGTGLSPIPPDDVLELVHELQVHQVELEMQNEELRRAQETVARSRDRYVDLYDLAPVGYVTLDPQGLILDLNLTGARLLGAPRNLLLKQPFMLFVAPECRQAFYKYLRQLSVSAAIRSCELKLNPQQGLAGMISLESLAMVEAGGKVIQYRTAMTDITRRHNAEDDLRRSEEKFRLLYEKAPLGYQSLDEDGIIREVNQAGLDILGYSRQEVIGRWFGDFLPPGYFEQFPERFACVKGAGEVCTLDFEMMRKDGALVTVSFDGRVAFDDQGRFVRTHCMFQDMTARKQAEEALRASEERLRLKLDSILSPDVEISDEDLSNILDIPAIQSLMEEFTKLTGTPSAILDLKGNVLVADGWQEICTRYHRVHPQTAQNCTESDLFLAHNLREGEYVAYKCKNHLWDVATPLFIGGKHVGNIYIGQFFYDDEPVDDRFFLDQAAKYGFDQEPYLLAIHRVPRLSRDRVNLLMDFLTKFSALVSRLSYSNVKLAQAMSEQQRIEAALRQSEEMHRHLFENMLNGFSYCKMLFEHNQPQDFIYLKVNSSFEQWTGLKNVVGKKVSEVIPGIRESDPELFKIYGRVALTGKPEKLETYVAGLKMWFSLSVYSPAKDHFVTIFDVITERKRAEAEILQKSQQLRALAARLTEVEEAERQHLGRVLHDQVCQGLTALGLTLALLQTQMPRKAGAALRARLADALALVEQTGETIRNLTADLRPPMLDDYGLMSALSWYGVEFFAKTGIRVEVQGQEVVPRLAAPVELALFRIAQEALTNVAKHARAQRVVLTEAEDHGTVRLVIADNGVGFDQDRLGQPEGRHLWGLMTMSERAAAAGGHCCIESQPGQGTKVVVEVSR